MKTNYLIFNFFLAIGLLMFVQNVSSQSLSTTITLVVDFGSTTPYSNSECGGILQSGDTMVYPPCNSFQDAGNRARQYLNSGLSIPSNNYLTINVINTAITRDIGGQSAQLGNLFGFCTIDILIVTTSSRAIIDGTNSTSNFVSLEEPNTISSLQCTSGKTMRIKNMEFKNWKNQTIIYTNLNQAFNSNTKQSIILTTVYTWSSNSIINVQPKSSNIEYGSVVFTSNSCYFNTIISSFTLPPFNFNGVNVNFVGSRFLNSTLNSSPFINSNIGYIYFKPTTTIGNVVINNGYPFIKTLNVGDNFYYNSLQVSNCVFSKFVQHENNKINTPSETTLPHISILYFTNVTITTNNNDPSNSFFSFQNFQGSSYTLVFETIVSSNVQVSGDKSFIWNQNCNTLISGFEVPNNFPIGINTQNSINNLRSFGVFSDIPFAGNNSIFDYQSYQQFSLPSTTNLNHCDICRISIEGQVVYDNY
ncbi:hypothetical protein ACTA71_011815 [Dictyostelium dimigraforme]